MLNNVFRYYFFLVDSVLHHVPFLIKSLFCVIGSEERILFDFSRALQLKTVFPGRSKKILLNLVGRLEQGEWDSQWKRQRLGRIYFTLSCVETNQQRRIDLLRDSLVHMPEHCSAREQLYYLLKTSSLNLEGK